MPSTTVASARSPRGDVLLRRRDDDGALELRVNGVFVMDTAETSSESGLAEIALARLSVSDTRGRPDNLGPVVLIGGLGLGFTLRRLFESGIALEIVVVEIEGALINWHRRGLIPATAQIVDDPRLTLVEGDVREVVEAIPPSTFDALILDVDNGPGFLVYDDNAAVYEAPFLAACHRVLHVGGSLVVWSADAAPDLDDTLRRTFGAVAHHATPVRLGTRDERYHTYAAVKVPAEAVGGEGDHTAEGPICPAP